MRIHFYSYAFFTLLLIIFAYFSATSLKESVMTSQDQEKAELNQVIKEETNSPSETRTNKQMNEIMGIEVCHDNDEECLARRMLAEAHLDYIYTQRHKP